MDQGLSVEAIGLGVLIIALVREAGVGRAYLPRYTSKALASTLVDSLESVVALSVSIRVQRAHEDMQGDEVGVASAADTGVPAAMLSRMVGMRSKRMAASVFGL